MVVVHVVIWVHATDKWKLLSALASSSFNVLFGFSEELLSLEGCIGGIKLSVTLFGVIRHSIIASGDVLGI